MVDNLENKEIINGLDFKKMILAAYRKFSKEHESINKLNVFPVPDGDTGTNMLLTLGSVAKAIESSRENNIGVLSKIAADSAIMGARGNSGVIFSQIFRGLARGLSGKAQAGSAEIGKAFKYAVLYAYRAVATPVEGTILTVAKGIAKGTYRATKDKLNIKQILIAAIEYGNQELGKTPDLLPVLKQAGVVDAGGKGLLVFLEGCLQGLLNSEESIKVNNLETVIVEDNYKKELETYEIIRPYCTEFIIKNTKIKVKEVRESLVDKGDSMVVVATDELIKVHIHTDHPGRILEMAMSWGSLHDIKIDNMADQYHNNEHIQLRAPKSLAIISVASGDGISKIMEELGAEIIIAGGQTMNPAVEDFMAAIHSNIAEKYIILPNNKNIILAANQVKKLASERVEVLATDDIAQGIAAIMVFDSSETLEKNLQIMSTRIQKVSSAAITTAVRDSYLGDSLVKKGSHIGVVKNKVITFAGDIATVLLNTLNLIVKEDSEIITLYSGAELTITELESSVDLVKNTYPQLEVEVYSGGQPLYHYFIAVE